MTFAEFIVHDCTTAARHEIGHALVASLWARSVAVHVEVDVSMHSLDHRTVRAQCEIHGRLTAAQNAAVGWAGIIAETVAAELRQDPEFLVDLLVEDFEAGESGASPADEALIKKVVGPDVEIVAHQSCDILRANWDIFLRIVAYIQKALAQRRHVRVSWTQSEGWRGADFEAICGNARTILPPSAESLNEARS